MIRAFALLLVAALPAGAQEGGVIQLGEDDISADAVRAVSASGAALRGLDKVSGETVELSLATGEAAKIGRLEVTLGECRYPEDNAAGEAYAWVSVTDAERGGAPLFEGWMIASSPALNAFDHARYDVWVMRCTTL